MSYDIAIGRCVAVDADVVIVRIEGAMLAKLDSTYRFHGPSKTLLKITREICSKTRPPKVDTELYIDHDATQSHPEAFLDVPGNGTYVPVNLAALLAGPAPGSHPAAQTARPSDYRIR